MKAKHKKLLVVTVLMLLMTALLVIVGCAPKPQDGKNGGSTSNGDDNPGIESPGWSMSSDCESCHAVEVASSTDQATSYGWHSAEPGVTCTTCHTDDNGKLTAAHAKYMTSSDPTNLRRTQVLSSSCLASGCHDEKELTAATASSTVLTDANGMTVNPHDIPDTATHVAQINCSSCHKMHAPYDVDKTAEDLCIGCHHEEIYECNTCH
jgi:predicted CXXCH cytochrome family protein